jgi:hypothetical protein
VLSLLALYKLCFVQVVESIRHDRKSCLNLWATVTLICSHVLLFVRGN